MKKRPINAYTLLEDVVNKMNNEEQTQPVGAIKDNYAIDREKVIYEECEDCERIGFGCFTCGVRSEKEYDWRY